MKRTDRASAGPGSSLTRRGFLELLGGVGGTGMVLEAMDAWGMGIGSRTDEPPQLSSEANGTRVVILGAGMAGMSAAYELRKWGYDTPILEARGFGGGRCQTIRSGSVREEVGGWTQRCDFDDGHYLNNGPWRIPHDHHSVLHYTKELGVPLEVMVNDNPRGWIRYDDVEGPLSGEKVRLGHVKADMRGYVAEILAKSIHQRELDTELSAEDRERLVEYLMEEGYLSGEDLEYTGGRRARGYAEQPGIEPGTAADPYGFLPLLRSGLGNAFSSVEQDQVMFQPVGGMDRLAVGFEREVGRHITYNAEVQEIRQSDDGVRIGYRNTRTGETSEVRADYCLCTIPLSVLMNIPSDFSARFNQAIRSPSYRPTGKMGLQFSRRFWEEDDGIYGGHSYTNGPVGRISYPSFNWQGRKGVIQGFYEGDTLAIRMSSLPPEERLEYAIQQGTKIHGDTYREEFETGFSFFWHLSKYNRGGYVRWTSRGRDEHYPVLTEPDGRVYLAGEHISYVTAWLAGAIESSWAQVEKLHQRATQEGSHAMENEG